MRIRFGYVSHALSLWDGSPSKTMTFTTWKKLKKEEREEKLLKATRTNLKNTLRALHYNIGHEIELYRMSSSIVPLATHPEVNWDYRTPFREELMEIGDLVKKHKLRVSFHPNQFTLFTSPKAHITKNAVLDLQYHYDVLDAMGIADQSIINIHVGGAYGDKESAIERFHKNLQQLPSHIKERMTLENDDKTYTASETLQVCVKEKIPLIFDYHHHMANLCEEPLEGILPNIFATWDHLDLKPKVHLSSPKSEKAFRSHADGVSLDFIKPFLNIAKEIGQDFDVMIEAKTKDQAMLNLMSELEKVRGYKRISGGTIEI